MKGHMSKSHFLISQHYYVPYKNLRKLLPILIEIAGDQKKSRVVQLVSGVCWTRAAIAFCNQCFQFLKVGVGSRSGPMMFTPTKKPAS